MDKKGIREVVKWWTVLEIVNIETGELISKSRVERENLRITNKTKKYEVKDGTGYRLIRWECKQHEQCKIEF